MYVDISNIRASNNNISLIKFIKTSDDSEDYGVVIIIICSRSGAGRQNQMMLRMRDGMKWIIYCVWKVDVNNVPSEVHAR